MNELRDHPNLYLRQHGNNPIHWKEWHTSTWKSAVTKNQLVIVSIGYSACHWCHVMEKECFEDQEIALFTNAHFISIKVDRETRPDIDQIYMNAMHLMGKPGGWPLNCICLPDGTPIFGGTYFPKNRWLKILSELNHLFEHRKDTLDAFAVDMKQALKQFSHLPLGNKTPSLDHDAIQSFIGDLDFEWGGTAGFPKFPMPPLIHSILYYGIKNQHKASLRWCQITLDKIKFGGIHDLVEGGISRYSVDHRWHIPHFEKMLFDNALLLSLYAQAHFIFPNKDYDQVMIGIDHWIQNEMIQNTGLVSSSMDADSDGEEGKYYVFSQAEIEHTFKTAWETWNKIFNFNHHSYWEDGKVVLSAKTHFSMIDDQWISVKRELQKIRLSKTKPLVDNKVITAWNAQLIVGYCQGASIFPDWKSKAIHLFDSLENHLKLDGQWVQGKEGHRAMDTLLFDTLAWIQKACVELFFITTEWRYIEESENIYNSANEFRKENGLYSLNSEEHEIAAIIETQDNVIPSSNAVWAENLYWLSIITGNITYRQQCQDMLSCIGQDINQINFYPHWNLLSQLMDCNAGIVVASMPEKSWLYNKKWLHKTIELEKESENVFLHGKWNCQTQYSLCTFATCFPPVTSHLEIA